MVKKRLELRCFFEVHFQILGCIDLAVRKTLFTVPEVKWCILEFMEIITKVFSFLCGSSVSFSVV